MRVGYRKGDAMLWLCLICLSVLIVAVVNPLWLAWASVIAIGLTLAISIWQDCCCG
jgi:hypothetical protein